MAGRTLSLGRGPPSTARFLPGTARASLRGGVTTSLPTGTRLGRYRLDRPLGTGASGSVYLAYDTVLETEVAIKVLSSDAIEAEEAWSRFKRELILARRLSHPSICRVFDIHEEGGSRFISMEFVNGRTLEAILREEGLLDADRAISLLRALCRALRVAHRGGVTHRDLKPMNIMVDGSGRPVILDFGFATAKDVKELTNPGTSLGTPHYMAPELVDGQRATPQTDLFALGVILYRCLTGRVPFPGENILEVAEALRRAAPRPPSQYNAAVKPDLEAVVLRAIARDTEQRYRGVDELEEALSRLTNDVEVGEDASQIVRSPWHGNLERTVVELAGPATFSQVIRQRIAPTTILFSDIVGITPYFDKFGDVRGRQLLETHNRLLFPIIGDHSGTIIKTIGDAIMASFTSSDSAVAAAMEMQRALHVHNRSVEEEDEIHIRIGLHSGQAIIERQDVFGNTVNVAARIGAKAEGDQILVSEATRSELQLHEALATYQSTSQLKGKEGSFALYSIDWQTLLETTRVEVAALDHRELTQPILPSAVAGARSSVAGATPWEPEQPAERTHTDVVGPGVDDPEIHPDDTSPAYRMEATEVVRRDTPIPEGDPDGDRDELTMMVDRGAVTEPVTSLRRSPALFAAAGIALLAIAVGSWALSRRRAPPPAEPPPVSTVRPEPPSPPPPEEPAPVEVGRIDPAPPPPPKTMSPVAVVTPTAPSEPAVERTERFAPAPAPRRDRDRDREPNKLSTLMAACAATMRERGILDGDDAELDKLRRKASRLSRTSPAEATVAADKAQALARVLPIDEAFVTGKLTRFNRRFDQVKSDAVVSQLEPIVAQILKSISAGDPAAANKHLNRGFSILDSSK
jgi:serine/threonine protein kinase